MQGVGSPASDSIPYSHSHSLDSAAEMVKIAADATVLNVVGIFDTAAGLSMKNAAIKCGGTAYFLLLI